MALTRPKYSQIYDTDWKQSAELATTGSDIGNLTVGNLQPSTVDGVSVQSGYRILVKDQTRGLENGLYTVANVGTGSNGWWTRTLDAAQSNFVTSGMSVVIDIGSTNAGREFRLTTPDPITLGSTALTFQVVGTPNGANTAIQFNDNNFFGGSSAFTFNKTSNAVVMSGTLSSGNLSISAPIAAVSLNDTISGNTTILKGSTGGNYTVTLPGVTGTLAHIGTAAQQFTGAVNFSGALNMNGSNAPITLGTNFANTSTLGNITLGSTLGGGDITIGRATHSQNLNLGTGVTGSGNTATINIGTNGLAGSNTTINIGSSLSNVNFNITGNTTHSGNLNVSNGNLNVTGTIWITGNILPTANVTYNLGSPTNKFKSAYFSGNTVYIGGESISVDSNGTWGFSSNGAVVSMGTNVPLNPPALFATGNVTTAAVYAPFIGNTGAQITGTIQTASQTNITQVGNLTSLSVAGATTFYSAPVITAATNATTLGTGALIVQGGGSFAKDLYVGGNLYAANIVSVNYSYLTVNDPLIYLQGNVYPYNFSIGFYGHFIGGPANAYAHTGFVRSWTNNAWYLFSNVAEPIAGNVNVSDANLVYDPLYSGAITVAGAVNASGNVLASTVNAGQINTTGNILATGGVYNALTVNGNIGVTTAWLNAGSINTTGNILATQLSVGTINTTGFINTTANVSAAIGVFGAVNSTGFINTSGNLSAATVLAGTINTTGFINTSGNVSAAVHVGGAVNVSGNILSTGAIHNSLTVNGTVNTNVASVASTLIAGAFGATGNIIANGSIIMGNTLGGYGSRTFFNPVTNSVDTVFG